MTANEVTRLIGALTDDNLIERLEQLERVFQLLSVLDHLPTAPGPSSTGRLGHKPMSMKFQTDHRSEGSGEIRNIHDILSDPRQRAILYHLQEHDGPVPVETALEWGDPSEADQTGDGIDAGRSDIQRSHLHELDRFGLLEYEPADDIVRIPDGVAYTVTAPCARDRSDTGADRSDLTE